MKHLLLMSLATFMAVSAAACGRTSESERVPAVASTRDVAHIDDRIWSFDSDAPGGLPEGWRAEQTNPRGEGAEWAVAEDANAPSGGRVLSLTDPRGATGSTYNLAWTDDALFEDGRIEVKVRASSGQEDRGGGPIWRVQNRDNYYVARWNPLENNFRLYFVEDGSRHELASANVKASPDQWHTIAIEHRDDRITGYLDGQRLLEATDDTHLAGGGIGVWTKADAASLFDDLVVTEGAP